MTRAALLLLALAAPASAEVPSVLADGAPTLGLAQIVMGDLGEPRPIIPLGGSVHGAGLTPGEAAAMTGAEVIVWAGPALTPWLAEAIAELAPDAISLPLLATPGWTPLPLRDGALLDGESGGPDPHAWLDPAVAAVWLGPIAEALAAADPDHAATYRANAEAGAARLTAMGSDLTARLAPLAGRGLVVGHDAYRYFERASGLAALGAIEGADEQPPSPARLAALIEAATGRVACVLMDPETNPDLAAAVTQDARVATADPEGLRLTPGPDLYARLIEGVAGPVEACLAP